MLQTGTLYTLVNDKNSVVKREPIANVFIYFSQNGKTKRTVKTDLNGKFSFDLPVGSYQVSISQGAGFRVFDLAGGAPFELTKDSKQNAFEEWVLSPIYLKPESNPLVLLLQDMIQNIQIEATEAISDVDKIREEALSVLNKKAEQVSQDATGAVSSINTVKNSAINNINAVKSSAVKDLNNIANQAKTSASNAKASENAAKKAVDDFNKNTVGSGRVLKEGAGGILKIEDFRVGDLNNKPPSYFYGTRFGFGRANGVYTTTMISRTWNDMSGRGGIIKVHFSSISGIFWEAPLSLDQWSNRYIRVYDTNNTTIDSNGRLKAASPIIRLFDDRIEHNGQFKEEPQFRKIDTGIYQIFNTLGLAKEGWTIETPEDKNGKPYFHIVVQKTYDGVIISVHDEYDVRRKKKIKDIFGEEQEVEAVEKILGEARDIKPHERWIDLRFHEEPQEEEIIGEGLLL